MIGWISDSYCSIKPLCSGMGEVVPARTSPTLLPPSPRTVLSLSCFEVSQCINCRFGQRRLTETNCSGCSTGSSTNFAFFSSVELYPMYLASGASQTARTSCLLLENHHPLCHWWYLLRNASRVGRGKMPMRGKRPMPLNTLIAWKPTTIEWV